MNILVFAGSSFCHFFYWMYDVLQAITLKRKIPQPISGWI